MLEVGTPFVMVGSGGPGTLVVGVCQFAVAEVNVITP